MSRNLKFPETLTEPQRRKGKRLMRKFVALNGISVAFLMNDLVILYGIRLGMSDPQLALLASFVHLTMPFMIIGKSAIRRYGAARTWGTGWILRNLSISIIIFAPLILRLGYAPQAPWLVFAGVFGFTFFRSIGLVGNSPLTGDITLSHDRGRFISGNFARARMLYLVSMIVVIILMRISERLWVYQVVIGLGCILGLYAGALLRRIPESRMPSTSARKPITQALHTLWNKKAYRKLFFAWGAAFSIWSVVIPFSVITVKNGYGLNDYQALSFTLILLVGDICSSLINTILSDRVGPRPLLILYSAGFFLVAGYWTVAPDGFMTVPTGIAFFLAGFCKTGTLLSVGHYFLSLTSENDRVGISLFSRIFSGAAAGIATSVIGGTILGLMQGSQLTGLGIYRNYFRIILLLLLPLFLIVTRLERLREWNFRSIFGLLFSPRDIRALLVMNRIDQSQDVTTDVDNLVKLGRIGSNLSESTLRAYLENSPRFDVRTHALHALRRIEVGEKTVKLLRNELDHGEYTSAWIAAEILGEQRISEAIPQLRRCLESGDQFLVGKSMVALARVQDDESYPIIVDLFMKAKNPRIVIHGAHALAETGIPEYIARLLEKAESPGLVETAFDELLVTIATLCGADEPFYKFLRDYNTNREMGEGEIRVVMRRVLPDVDCDTVEESVVTDALLRRFREYDSEPFVVIREYLEARGRTPLSPKLLFCLVIILGSTD